MKLPTDRLWFQCSLPCPRTALLVDHRIVGTAYNERDLEYQFVMWSVAAYQQDESYRPVNIALATRRVACEKC